MAILDATGCSEAADLLEAADVIYVEGMDESDNSHEAQLAADPRSMGYPPKDVLDKIDLVLDALTSFRQYRLTARPSSTDWRQHRRRARPVVRFLRSGAEAAVYEALLRKQASLSETDTVSILPNPSVRVSERWLEPDFLVVHGGRVGAIEVDGPYHKGRAADDHKRKTLFRSAGVRLIERIDVDDTNDPQLLDRFVSRFLARLANQ